MRLRKVQKCAIFKKYKIKQNYIVFLLFLHTFRTICPHLAANVCVWLRLQYAFTYVYKHLVTYTFICLQYNCLHIILNGKCQQKWPQLGNCTFVLTHLNSYLLVNLNAINFENYFFCLFFPTRLKVGYYHDHVTMLSMLIIDLPQTTLCL